MAIVYARLVEEKRGLEMKLGVGAPMGSGFRSDVILNDLDVPSPAIRAVVTDRIGGSGTEDLTEYHGARSVSATLTVFDNPATLYDELMQYLHPASRPVLYVLDDEWEAERRLRLRVDQYSGALDNYSHWWRQIQLQWQCPDGAWESGDEVAFGFLAQASDAVGRVYPMITPRTYAPLTGGTGIQTLVNPGSSPSHYKVRLYGPCNGPRWTNDDTGESVIFLESFAIPAGEYVEIDTRAHTAYYLSDPSASRLGMLDFPNSAWWQLAPGPNRVRYNPVSGVDAGCAAAGEYRPVWL